MTRQPRRELIVVSAEDTGATVRSLLLGAHDGTVLPSYPAGSHIGVVWGENRLNSYSLTGSGSGPRQYAISVKLEPAGRGGSAWLHGLQVGDVVVTTAARSAFLPVARARHHVLVAGGIGITAILSHAAWHRRWGTSFEAWAVGVAGPLVDRLREIAGDRIRVCEDRREFWASFRPRLAEAPFGSETYTCGPEAMIAAVRETALAAGWPEQRVHSESFGRKDASGRPFDVALSASGRRIHVPAGRSMLEALEGDGVPIPSLCRNGVCGECLTRVRRGRIDHRDDYLSEAERAAGELMMPCVSRAAETEVEVEW